MVLSHMSAPVIVALFIAAAPLFAAEPAARGVELFRLPAMGGTEVVVAPDGSAWTVGGDFRGEASVLYQLTPEGELIEVETPRDPGWHLTSGPGGAVWAAGGGELLRFDPLSRMSIVIRTGLSHVSDLREGPDGNLWVVGAFGDWNQSTWALVTVSPNGSVLDARSLPRRMDSAATAGELFWMTPGYPYDDHAFYTMTTAGAITRHPLPFVPVAVFAGPDLLWITALKGVDGAVTVAFDGRVVSREATAGGVEEAAVDHHGNLWFAYEASLLLARRGAPLLRYALPPIPDATCHASTDARPLAFTSINTLVMTADYEMCNGPCPPYDPCVANPPADFLMRVNLEEIRQPRRRSVGR